MRSLLMLFSVVKLSCKDRVKRIAIVVAAKGGIELFVMRKFAWEIYLQGCKRPLPGRSPKRPPSS